MWKKSSYTPKTFGFKNILESFKKLFWMFLIAIIIFNIVLFYFFNGVLYFIIFIIWNIIFTWLSVPIVFWIGKTILIDKGIEIVDEVKEKFSKENIVKVVERKEFK